MHRVYVITNRVNDKRYVGITEKSIEARFREHIYAAFKRNSTCALHCAIRRHGVMNFSIIEIESDITRWVAGILEVSWIQALNTHVSTRLGYNQTFGGDGAYGYRHSTETIEQMRKSRQARKMHKCSEATKELLRNSSKKSKTIVQIDQITGDVVAIHKSMRSAARAIGAKDHSSISHCCNGTHGVKSAHGYFWKFTSTTSIHTSEV